MVGDSVPNQEYLLGYTPEGNYEIIARPGKFFFQKKKNFSSIFSFLCNFDRVNV